MTPPSLYPALYPAEASIPGTLLALGVDTRLVRACLLEPVGGRYRLIHWGDVPRQDERPLEMLVAQVCQRLGDQLGRTVWDAQQNAPWTHSADPVREPPITGIFATLGLRSPLRVWLAGLSQERSLAVARRAVRQIPATICGTTCLERQIDVTALNQSLLAAQPQVLLICGGYEGATTHAQESIWRLCALVGSVLRHLPPAQQPLCIYAGNSAAAPEAERIMQVVAGSMRCETVANAHPGPGETVVAPLGRTLHDYSVQLHRRTPEYVQLARWLAHPAEVLLSHVAFARAVQAWRLHQHLPDLHGVYEDETGRLHVWASERDEGVQTFFADRHEPPPELHTWPPLQLVSGLVVSRKPDSVRWQDPLGLLPIVTAVGQADPLAMVDVFAADLLYED